MSEFRETTRLIASFGQIIGWFYVFEPELRPLALFPSTDFAIRMVVRVNALLSIILLSFFYRCMINIKSLNRHSRLSKVVMFSVQLG